MNSTNVCGVLLVAVNGLLVGNAYGFGKDGHQLVGDIAESILEGKPVTAKIDQMLDGLTLGQAALLPDEIKGWDKKKTANSGHTVMHPKLIEYFATHERPSWKLPGAPTVERWAEAWADEILSISHAAHERLEFDDMLTSKGAHESTAKGLAKEKKPSPDGKTYLQWSGDIIEAEIAKAGWRLAALLEAVAK